MHTKMNDLVRAASRELETAERTLSEQTEKLWLSTGFGARADAFQQRLDQAFAEVLSAEPVQAATSVEIAVEDWEYLSPARRRPRSMPGLIFDLLRNLVGFGRPLEDYLGTLHRVTRCRQFTVPDPRVPGGGECLVNVPVRLHETQPPELTVPKGDHVQPILSGLSVKISRAWYIASASHGVVFPAGRFPMPNSNRGLSRNKATAC
jgi:hypothetical protein